MAGGRLSSLAVAVAILLSAFGAWAADLAPALPKAKGERCVEDSATMRRDHMDLLKHQRDATLRLGIRGERHSLKDCVTCHAADGADGKPVAVNAEGQFCQSCHSYAAVAPDCFSCHSPVPERPARTADAGGAR